MSKKDKLPLPLVPETRADYFRFVLHRLWMQNVICDHKYKIQKCLAENPVTLVMGGMGLISEKTFW